MSETRRYYDFSHLLGGDRYLSDMERSDILRISTGKEIVSAMVTAVTNAFVIYGDFSYGQNSLKHREVSKERDIEEVDRILKTAPTPSVLADHINYKLSLNPPCRVLYTRLFDFELLLIKQKSQRLTSRKSAL